MIDLKAIVKKADEAGVEFAFVEQGGNWVNNDAIESAKKSFKWFGS